MARKPKSEKGVIQFPSSHHEDDNSFSTIGVVIGLGGHFFWYAGADDVIAQKRDNAAKLTDPDRKRERDRAWFDAALYYGAYDLVTLSRFLRDFDAYSKSILGPQTSRERAVRCLGYTTPEEELHMAKTVSERRSALIKSIRSAAFDDAAFVFSGREFIADASYGETQFDHALLDIRNLFYWLVNDSKLDMEWIPFQVREWVKNNHPVGPQSTVIPVQIKGKKRTRYAISAKDAADKCGVSKREMERWLSGKHAPDGFPGLHDSGVFLAWAETYKGRKAIFSKQHGSGHSKKQKGKFDALVADNETDI